MDQLYSPQPVSLLALTPAPWNPRSIKDERFANLCRSLEADPEFLQLRPILATLDGTSFAGNMRYRAALPRLGADRLQELVKEVVLAALQRSRGARTGAMAINAPVYIEASGNAGDRHLLFQPAVSAADRAESSAEQEHDEHDNDDDNEESAANVHLMSSFRCSNRPGR